MQRNTIQLFRVYGIPVKIHVSWLIIFFLITWSLAAGHFPQAHPDWSPWLHWLVGGVTSLLFFLSVLLHELSHSVVARMRGMGVKDIVLFVFGGVSEISDEPLSAESEFLMAFVGPLTSFLLSGLAFIFHLLLRGFNEALAAVTWYLCWINILLGAFNLVPGFPLDGGRVLRSVIWGITGNLQRATRWAVRSGMLVSYGLILLGIWMFFGGNVVGGLWFIFIGWFLNSAAQATQSRAAIRRLLSGHRVRELVNRDCAHVPAELPLDALVNEHILAEGRRCLPAVENDHVVGLITVHHVKQVPREAWGSTAVRAIMMPIEQVKSVEPDSSLWTAFREMSEEGVNQLAVIQDGRLVGMLGRDALMGFIRLRAELEE